MTQQWCYPWVVRCSLHPIRSGQFLVTLSPFVGTLMCASCLVLPCLVGSGPKLLCVSWFFHRYSDGLIDKVNRFGVGSRNIFIKTRETGMRSVPFGLGFDVRWQDSLQGCCPPLNHLMPRDVSLCTFAGQIGRESLIWVLSALPFLFSKRNPKGWAAVLLPATYYTPPL